MMEYDGGALPERALSDYWVMLRRRKWLVLGPFILAVAAGLFATTRIRPVFRAEAKLLVPTTSPSLKDLGGDEPLAALAEPAQPEGVDTQIEVLKSEPFIERVFAKSGLPRRLDPRRPIIEAEHVGTTNVIDVTVEGPDPKLAARVANTMLDQYLEYTSENTLKQIQAAKQLLEPDHLRAQQALAKAERRLLEYEQHLGVAEVTAERNGQAKELEELGTQSVENRSAMTRAAAELRQVEAQLEQEPAVKQTLEERPNPRRDALDAKLAELETQRATLLAEYREHSSTVTAIDAQIKMVKLAQAAEPMALIIRKRVPNPIHDQLRARQMELRRLLSGLQAESRQLSLQLSTSRRQLNQLGSWDTRLSQLTSMRDTARRSFLMLDEKLAELAVRESERHSTARILQHADVSTTPVRSRAMKLLMMAAAMGLVLGLSLGFLQEYREDRVTTPEAVERMLGAPVLSYIPLIPAKQSPLMMNLPALGEIADSYRCLRSAIHFATVGQPLRTIMVASADPNEGKSLTAINLAMAIALDGQNVILVDADLRHPSVYSALDLRPEPGLADVLLDRVPAEHALQVTQMPGLRVLTSGTVPPYPAELVNSVAMQRLIAQLAEQADVLIFDSSPSTLVPDAQLLSAKMDGVLLVVDVNSGRRAGINYTVDQFRQAGAPLLGVACNKVSGNQGPGYRYYRYRRHPYRGQYLANGQLVDGQSNSSERDNAQGDDRGVLTSSFESTEERPVG